MALSELTTPKLVHSSFAQVLHADGPDTGRATELALYSWMVGRWEMDVTTILEDGTTHRGKGEIHAGWVLWSDPVTNFFTQQIGRAQGRDIVQTGPDPRGGSMRWVFSEIEPQSFHWTAERAQDDRNWRREVDIRARRV